MSSRHKKRLKRKKKQNTEVSRKRRREERCESAGEDMAKNNRLVSKSPRDKRKRDEELEEENKSVYYSAEEQPFKTAKEHLSSRPKDGSGHKGTKRPAADTSDRRSHMKRKRETRHSLSQDTAGISGIPSSSTPDSHTTSLTLDSLTIHSLLGMGGYGKVMLASHPRSKQQLALKMVKKRLLLEDCRENILVERQVLEITGRNMFFTHAFATFQTADYVFYAMEYLGGGDLRDLIAARAPLDIATARFLAAEMACGLSFLHSNGIVHRDLKPENIILDSAGHAKIADFGLAVFGVQKISGYAGTLRYMAPEMILGKSYNALVDLFSFGVILYEMAVGKYPFHAGRNPSDIERSIVCDTPSYPDNLNSDIQDILERLLCKSPVNRLAVCRRIRGHPFFSQINWVELKAGRIQPPFQMESNKVLEITESCRVEDLLSSGEAQKPPISPEDERLFCGFSFVSDRWRSMERSPYYNNDPG